MGHKEYLKIIDDTISRGKYKADWASLSGHKTPDWYYNAKFGIFIHWGIYSVPAFGSEWYARHMYDPAHPEYEHHRKTYGSQKDFGYKDFIPMFTADKFDPVEWAALFKKAGARFVMPVCEHHDGFAMYDTEFNRWNAAEMGPCRDAAREIKEACEREGLTFCASTHRAEHFFFMNMGRAYESDVTDEETAVLEEIGEWMSVNGEGIYDTVPWKQFGEGEVNNQEGSFRDNEEKGFTSEDYRFTYKNGYLYAFCMRPDSDSFLVRSLKKQGHHDFLTGSVKVLGDHTVTHTERDDQGLRIVIDKKPVSDKPLCFKIEIT